MNYTDLNALGTIGHYPNQAVVYQTNSKWWGAPYSYYWQIVGGNPDKFHGPFKSIPDVTFHYDCFIKAKNTKIDINAKVFPVATDNVIYVDFKAKRRIK